VAYRLLLSHRFPSWLYSVDQGATTVWERWDAYVKGRGFQNRGMNSFNHVAIGAVGEWMYSHILGIRYDESQPGYQHFYIQPQPGGDFEWVKGNYHSIAGDIEVAWAVKDEVFTLELTVPVNTEATVVMPSNGQQSIDVKGGKPLKKSENTLRLGSGKYTLTTSINK
jgi:alpha-L-rhamnosidase